MQKKSLFVYPKIELDERDPRLVVVDAPVKTKLKAYISGYVEDYGELPDVSTMCDLFRISRDDAQMALIVFKPAQ